MRGSLDTRQPTSPELQSSSFSNGAPVLEMRRSWRARYSELGRGRSRNDAACFCSLACAAQYLWCSRGSYRTGSIVLAASEAHSPYRSQKSELSQLRGLCAEAVDRCDQRQRTRILGHYGGIDFISNPTHWAFPHL